MKHTELTHQKHTDKLTIEFKMFTDNLKFILVFFYTY